MLKRTLDESEGHSKVFLENSTPKRRSYSPVTFDIVPKKEIDSSELGEVSESSN